MDSTELDVDEVEILDHYQSLLNQLLELICDIASEWQAHFYLLQRRFGIPRDSVFQLSTNRPRSGPGQPKFDISKEQLEYLSSMSFSWSQIAEI